MDFVKQKCQFLTDSGKLWLGTMKTCDKVIFFEYFFIPANNLSHRNLTNNVTDLKGIFNNMF